MGSTLGKLFRIMTWGESHGGGVGVVLEGCPPRLAITAGEIQVDLDRRKPGTTSLVSQRKETDEVQILSGVFEGETLGTPVSLFVPNKDARSKDYEEMKHVYRPSHADYTYDAKYGIRNWKGGGRASARETVGRVAAGAIARKLLSERAGIEIVAYVTHVKDVAAGAIDRETVTRADVDANDMGCPDRAAADRMIDLVK
ncbi:MAG: chorismate synthase, partial [Gemmatimonadetes bacterium]|nr:chorismate synthase [Gemmatimonadota bacterium]